MSLKVLHLVYSLAPGGMENGIVNMSINLASEKISMEVCCLERAGRMASRLSKKCHLHVLGKKPGFDRRLPRILRDKINEIGPDIIHTHNLGPLIYAAMARFLGVTIPIFHGEHASLTLTDLRLRKRLQRILLYRLCKKIHTVGDSMTRQLDELKLSPTPVLTLRNGVDTVLFQPNKDKAQIRKELLDLSGELLLVGVFGRFGPYKRHEFLLEAFAEIGEKLPNIHLLIVGGGGDRERVVLDKIQCHPLRSRIHAVGYQTDPVAYYQCLDLLLLPSENEGLSNCALEAMACGVPVLTNQNCGSEDLILHGVDGFVRPLISIDNLLEGLTDIFAKDMPTLENVSVMARKKIENDFSLDSMANSYRKAYQDLALMK
ncbi:MAG: glycosyltransferase [Opitutae bacterium]|nr:glycosyltransferase [Opitutae bacterium]